MCRWRKAAAFLAVAAMAAALVLSAPAGRPAQAEAAETAELVILTTTDLHGNIYPWDYFNNRASDVGLAKVMTLVREIRAAHPATVLVDNGDTFQGTPLAYYYAKVEPLGPGDLHPMVKAMNLMGYDAAALGNHEYNYGLDFLAESINDAQFPFLSANVFKAGTQEPLHTPYVIVDKALPGGGTVKVGIIGFTSPGIIIWDATNLAGRAETGDIVAAAKRFVPEMQAQGAEVLVALAHTGASGTSSYDAAAAALENAARVLAEQVQELDVVVAGHSHALIPGKGFEDPRVGRVLLSQPGNWGNHLGVVTLQLTRTGGGWTVAGGTSELKPVKGVPADPALLAALQAEHENSVAYVNRSIGTTETPIITEASLVADTGAIQLINDVQIARVKAGIKGTPHEALPVLSAAAPFSLRVNVRAGNVSIADMASLYIYDNTLRAIVVTGKDLKGWLEHAAQQFAQVAPGTGEQPIFNPAWRSYNYDQIDGVSYEIDITKPVGERIVNLTHAGRPIAPETQFVVATNNYRADGGGGFPGTGKSAVVAYDKLEESRQLIIEYVETMGTVAPKADGNWRLAHTYLKHWSAPAAYEMVDRGIAMPDAEGRFKLTGAIPAGELTAMLRRAGLHPGVLPVLPADEPVTRLTAMQTVAYAVGGRQAAAGDPAVLSRFGDGGQVTSFRAPVAWAVAQGLVRGDTTGLLRPADALTRAEAIQLVYNAVTR